MNIYLPSATTIKGDNAEFTLNGSADSSKAPSYDITLDHEGKIRFAENEWNDSSSRFFKIVNLHADHSSGIELANYAVVDEMNLVLMTSSFEDKNAVINAGSIQADSEINSGAQWRQPAKTQPAERTITVLFPENLRHGFVKQVLIDE